MSASAIKFLKHLGNPQIDHGLFTERGVEWLHSLGLEPVESYLRAINVLNNEIKQLSKHLKELAEDDDDIRLLMTIPGVGYYTALLVKSEIGDINRFSDGDTLCSCAGLQHAKPLWAENSLARANSAIHSAPASTCISAQLEESVT